MLRVSIKPRLVVSIAPHEIGAITLSAGLRTSITRKSEIRLDNSGDYASALHNMLSRHSEARELSVVLRLGMCRLFMVPWRKDMTSPHALQAFAAIQHQQLFGQEKERWQISTSAPRHNTPVMASSMPERLMTTLQTECASRKIKLTTVQPLLSCIHDARHQLLGNNACLIVQDGHKLAYLKSLNWLPQAVSTLPSQELASASDIELLRRRTAHPEGTIALYTVPPHLPIGTGVAAIQPTRMKGEHLASEALISCLWGAK